MMQWILVDKNFPPDQRRLLASCETFRKRALIGGPLGDVRETIAHGIASVYVSPEYRGRGYASRMLRELDRALPTWQTRESGSDCIASVLYSDIGGEFYARLGWRPAPCHHISLEPARRESTTCVRPLNEEDLEVMCKLDGELVWTALASPSQNGKSRFAILPDWDHMRWHHRKEEFVCERLFGKTPNVKGAVAGELGSRIWVVWTHRYYEHPDNASGNTLYILRLGVEDQRDGMTQSGVDVQVENLRLVLEAARAEAFEWDLQTIQLWDPSPTVTEWIERTGIPHRAEKRTEEGIGCLRWYGKGEGKQHEIDWLYNEKYAWC